MNDFVEDAMAMMLDNLFKYDVGNGIILASYDLVNCIVI